MVLCGPVSAYGRTITHVADGYPVFLPSLKAISAELADADLVHVFTAAAVGFAARRAALEAQKPLVVSYLTDLERYWALHRTIRLGARVLECRLVRRRFGVQARRLRTPRAVTVEFLRGADAIVVPTRAVARGIRELTELPPTVLPVRPELESKLLRGTADGSGRFLYLGRLSREKDVDWLIDSFSYVRDQLPGAHLRIAGTGDMRDALVRFARRKGLSSAVEWLGEVERENVLPTLAASTALLHPSVTDTQAVVIYEAMVAGTPVVVRDPQLTWIEQVGFRYRLASDPETFAAAAVEIARGGNALRTEFQRENARALAAFSDRSDIDRLLNVYEKTLSARRGDGGTIAQRSERRRAMSRPVPAERTGGL